MALHLHAAADGQGAAGDMAGHGGHEEYHAVGHVVRSAQLAHGDHIVDQEFRVLGTGGLGIGHQVGAIRGPGADCVDADAVFRVLLGSRLMAMTPALEGP